MNTKLDSYRTADTMGKSPVDLVIKIYDGAIKAFRSAQEAYQEERSNDGFDELQKARKFITHLYTTLNMEQGGDIAENLGKLYTLILTQTDVAEGTKDQAMIQTNIDLLNNLREGWLGVSQQKRKESPSRTEAGVDSINAAM